MSLLQEIKNYQPVNEQEENDKAVMLQFMESYSDYLTRENKIAHFSTAMWTVNKEQTKMLMVYHNIYDTWSWTGGHADGIEDLYSVAMRELWEETGVSNAQSKSKDIFGLEILTVSGHEKKGIYVPSHLHFNVTYLAEADENEELVICEKENSGVQWWTFEDAIKASKEPWMIERVYKKYIAKCSI